MTPTVWIVATAALVPAALRWLRVAQREHYAAGMVTRFARRWWSTGANRVLALFGVGAALVAAWVPALGLVAAAVVAVGPLGLSVRGATSPLRWTARLRRLGGTLAVMTGTLVALGALTGLAITTVGVAGVAMALLVDASLWVTAPMEFKLSRVWVHRARERLDRVSPVVVGVTGSYGKTTTKAYIAQLLSSRYDVVASPASFNNELGLARTINEHLGTATQVFVAEMGTYGVGELASLVAWIRPRISVITAIGPVHLERFGSLERIVRAKAEILEDVETAVLNVDSPELSELAGRVTRARVVRCSSSNPSADVYVGGAGDPRIVVEGATIAELSDPAPFSTNLACAVAVAWILDVPLDADRLGSLQNPAHRRQRIRGSGGFDIIDDTYNANPAGAWAGVALLDGGEGRRVVVTPGMVELGEEQAAANREFARRAAVLATDLLIVGQTNRRALLEGAKGGPASVKLVRSRDEAVDWVRRNLGPGDLVLYENDLPDHYP